MKMQSQSPRIGAVVQTTWCPYTAAKYVQVSIPSNRGSVSDKVADMLSCIVEYVSIPSNRGSGSDRIVSMN
ncbi:hypothetical protein dsmv_3698 [Desulfococcus multivorans DSM 2059]|uniref:Uncharacterized protein n=1 Tax=Desulfococcus multivorans DSM 2059 TaxID=1121405 RepID=S7VKF8_DESML|nr:hypothetical protein dsmv_3698 [Desulfococcus multivorans DSM 2059]